MHVINGEQIADAASLTQELEYLPLNLVLPQDKKAMDQTFFSKVSKMETMPSKKLRLKEVYLGKSA